MFIKTYHPKKSMHPTKQTIATLLKAGWIAQAKMNGKRAQIHVNNNSITNYTRSGTLHTSMLPKDLQEQILNVLANGTAIEAEWVQHENKLYIFDMIKFKDTKLYSKSYQDRYKMLPQLVGSLTTLPLIQDEKIAYARLMDQNTEGLVFKNPKSIGFNDSSIIRCRRSGITFKPERRKNT